MRGSRDRNISSSSSATGRVRARGRSGDHHPVLLGQFFCRGYPGRLCFFAHLICTSPTAPTVSSAVAQKACATELGLTFAFAFAFAGCQRLGPVSQQVGEPR